MLPEIQLSPRLENFLADLADQPAHIREQWRYAVFLMLLDDDCARILSARRHGNTLCLTVQTTGGTCFQVLQPELTEDQEQSFIAQLRALVREDCASDAPK